MDDRTAVPVNIAIVGGGIGGLAAAIALRHEGYAPIVYEAAPALQPAGAGIWVPPNAMHVLSQLGAGGDVEAAGMVIDAIRLQTVDGTVLQTLDAAALRRSGGAPLVSIARTHLVRCLAAHLPADSLRLGKRCRDAAQDAAGVTLRFDDGSDARADLVVAADGIHSGLRELVQPAVTLRYAGQTCYRGIGRCDAGALRRTCLEQWGGRARFGLSGISSSETYWFAPITAPARTAMPREDLKAWLLETYRHFAEPVEAILRATPDEQIIQTDLYDFAPLRRWSAGHVVLLGDAAHAMTPNLGQGGAQAVEDAWVLAACLREHGEQVGAALHAYEHRRRRRTRWTATTAWRIGRMAHVEGRVARWVRDAAIRLAPDFVQQRQTRRLFAPPA